MPSNSAQVIVTSVTEIAGELHQREVGAEQFRSAPWHNIFAFLIPTTGAIVQMHYHSSSPLDEHPASIWIFMICSLSYCFALGHHIKCQIYSPTNTVSLNRSVKVAFIAGSLAFTSLISALVPRFLQPLVFIICFKVLFIYFNRKKIAEIGGNMVSYLCDLWTTTKSKASSLYDRGRRNESGNVPAMIRPPV